MEFIPSRPLVVNVMPTSPSCPTAKTATLHSSASSKRGEMSIKAKLPETIRV